MKKRFALLGFPLLLSTLPAFSATVLNLNHASYSAMSSYLDAANSNNIKEMSRHTDLNNTAHIRFQQTYQGHRVWGGEGVLHVANADANQGLQVSANKKVTMNGKLYQHLEQDLQNLSTANVQSAIDHVLADYQQKMHAQPKISNVKSELIVYVDANNKANWAYFISFDAAPIKARALPERPTYIINANDFKVYKTWNDIQTLDNVKGGGFGGNEKMGKLTYDALEDNLPPFKMKRDAATQTCYLKNKAVVVHDVREKGAEMTFSCPSIDKDHKVYWDGEHDSINGGFSPGNDAFYEGGIIKTMYKKWYDLDVLTKNGKPMTLNMYVHENMLNAYWDGKKMVFGDGDGVLFFYPLTSLDVAAHEISHGFTQQHSNLTYEGMSGGMNESFSDMAAQAAYYYADGDNNWKIGADITLWLIGDAIRYMDIPSKDCKNTQPGDNCSIDDASQYNDKIDVHFTSGVYNRLFYSLATSKGWTTRKAFDVMVKANMDYWTANSTFEEGACGIIQAAQDLKYDAAAVKKALLRVGLEGTDC